MLGQPLRFESVLVVGTSSHSMIRFVPYRTGDSCKIDVILRISSGGVFELSYIALYAGKMKPHRMEFTIEGKDDRPISIPERLREKKLDHMPLQ
jgi:hypothetical protein